MNNSINGSYAWMSLRMWKQFPGAGDKSFAGGGNR